jgi:hypothetical protein
MTAPSRQFMIQQAVLNAVPKVWPATFFIYKSVRGALVSVGYRNATKVSPAFHAHILQEYRTLSARYDEAISQPGALR